MASPTEDPTVEACSDVSDEPTMETIGVLSDVPMAGRSLHIGVASANFKVTGFGGIVENAKVNINKLYLRQIFAGWDANQSDVNNWGIYNGPGSMATLVAKTQGTHTLAGEWSNWFTLVFVVKRFEGSTLQVIGAIDEKESDWSIVGGTGDFAMARGIIRRKVINPIDRTQELTLEFFCNMKGVVAPPSPGVPARPRIPIRIKRGPWGGNGGSLKEMEGKSQRLESLTIYHEGTVEGFQFSYVDEDGQIHTTSTWGTNHNRLITEIKFGPSEYVKQIAGAGHRGNPSKLCQFKIVTNYSSYGPFGDWNGTPFSSTVPENETVVGFFGSTDNDNHITTIGVYTISK